MSGAVAVNERHNPLVTKADAENLRFELLRSAAQARIQALRDELTGTRRRNAELVKEVDRLVLQRDSAPVRRAAWSERFASWSARIERTRGQRARRIGRRGFWLGSRAWRGGP